MEKAPFKATMSHKWKFVTFMARSVAVMSDVTSAVAMVYKWDLDVEWRKWGEQRGAFTLHLKLEKIFHSAPSESF